MKKDPGWCAAATCLCGKRRMFHRTERSRPKTPSLRAPKLPVRQQRTLPPHLWHHQPRPKIVGSFGTVIRRERQCTWSRQNHRRTDAEGALSDSVRRRPAPTAVRPRQHRATRAWRSAPWSPPTAPSGQSCTSDGNPMLAKTSGGQPLLIATRLTKESTSPLDADRRVTSADQAILVRIKRAGCRRITPEDKLSDFIRRKLFKLVRFGIVEVSEYRACHCPSLRSPSAINEQTYHGPKVGAK